MSGSRRAPPFPSLADVSDDDGMSTVSAPNEGADEPRRTPAPHALVEQKGTRRISVCIPARNEAATVGPIVDIDRVDADRGVRRGATGRRIVVVDDGSDGRDRRARPCGRGPGHRRPERAREARARPCARRSKAAEGDLIVFVDADVTNFGPHFVTGLLGAPAGGRIGHPGEGLLPAAPPRRPRRGRPCHRAGGQADHRPAVPAPGLDRTATGRGDGRSPVGAGEVRAGRRLCGRARPPDRRGRPLRGGERSPRSTSGSGCTATDRSRSYGHRRPTSCGLAGPRPRLDHR